MQEPHVQRNFINFRRIGFEFRRIDKNNSPIATAALIINQSLCNPSALLEEIIKSNEYQNLLKISLIFYRRFETDPMVHFNSLISLVNWSSGNHLGEYVFLQIILGIPDTQISRQDISLAIQLFPTLFEPIFISRIYANPNLLFTSECPKLPANQLITADYLIKCGADNLLIEQFLTLTFDSSLNFFRQVCESRRYNVLLGLLNLRPDFFIAIENICRDDLFNVVSQIMNSGITSFLNIFFNYYKKIPQSIIKCVSSNLNSGNISQYAKKLGKQNYQNLFNFIFENEYSEMINDGFCFNDNFIPCVNDLYQKNPDLVLRIFRVTNNQTLNSTILSILISSSNEFSVLPYSLVDAILSKPDFAFDIQNEYPQFFVSILKRYPSYAMEIAGIISQKQYSLNSEPIYSNHPFLSSEKGSSVYISQPGMPKPNDYSKKKGPRYNIIDDEDMDLHDFSIRDSMTNKSGDNQSNSVIIPNSKKLFKLIYEIDENAFCGCFSSNSNSIVNTLLNFVPKLYTPKLQTQKSDSLSTPTPSDDILSQIDGNHRSHSDPRNITSKYHKKTPRSCDNQSINDNDDDDNNNKDDDDDNSNESRGRYHRPKIIISSGNETNKIRSNKSKNSRNIKANAQNQPEANTSKKRALELRKRGDMQPSRFSDLPESDQGSEDMPESIYFEDLKETVLNPHHLHFPSSNFFTICELRNLISAEDLSSFFASHIDFIVNDNEWVNIIPQVPLLFYQFLYVILKHDELRKHYMPLTIKFATNMCSTFRNDRDSFTSFTEFLLNSQSQINVDDFPLYMKIKIVDLLVRYMDNIGGPMLSLFMLMAKDYRSFISLDSVSKDIIWNVYIKGNLENPNCHRAFIMAYEDHNKLIQPHTYIDSIMKNRESIASTLSDDDEIYFERWYNLVIKGLNSQIYQTAQMMAKEQAENIGNTPIFKFFRTVMLNALVYTKFQNDIEFLSILIDFLNPQSVIYSIRGQAEAPHTNASSSPELLSLNIPKNILKIVLKNKSERPPNEEIAQRYHFIYDEFLTFYPSEIFNVIPIASIRRTTSNEEHG